MSFLGPLMKMNNSEGFLILLWSASTAGALQSANWSFYIPYLCDEGWKGTQWETQREREKKRQVWQVEEWRGRQMAWSLHLFGAGLMALKSSLSHIPTNPTRRLRSMFHCSRNEASDQDRATRTHTLSHCLSPSFTHAHTYIHTLSVTRNLSRSLHFY